MTVGGYEVVRRIGGGGMGEVYEAVDPRLGSRRAVKLYSYPKDDPDVRRRFVAEGELLARLSHPRVVKVTDFGVDGATGRPYFAMDFIDAGDGGPKSLADMAGCGEDEIGRWYDDIREGLAYIHSKGVVHRDLKLQNVLVGPDGHAVLTDFGVSRIDRGGSAAVEDAVDTLVGVAGGARPVMGSLGYLAPELELGAEATPQSDWYALGVMVYYLLTGTWCDRRTDVASELDTYDPAWKRVLPQLLHSNPNGRKCPSFAEARARAAALSEESLRRSARGWRACAVAAAGAAAVLAVVSFAQTVGGSAATRRLHAMAARIQSLEGAGDFEHVFALPEGRVLDSSGEEIATEDLRAAQIDAWVLARGSFRKFRRGELTREGLVDDVRRLCGEVAAGRAAFGEEYIPQCDSDEAMEALFLAALRRLEAMP